MLLGQASNVPDASQVCRRLSVTYGYGAHQSSCMNRTAGSNGEFD